MRTYKQVQEDIERNKQRLLRQNPNLDDDSGIYILYRIENGIKFAYIGQARHLLSRLSQHFEGFQHIDLSLRKRGLAFEDEEKGYNVHFFKYPLDKLDEMEQYWIKRIANNGYQLYNHNSGGSKGKSGFDNQRPAKGYHDGLAQGRKNLARELSHIVDTHLEITLKKDTKVSQKALQKFYDLLKGE
jgi:hypothetical protein